MENLFQTRVKEFENGILPFKNFISNTQVKSLIETSDTFFDAFRTLGVGELYARQFERQSQLKALSAHAKYSQSMFRKYNDIGNQRITEAANKLNGVSKELSSIINPKDLKNIEPKIKDQIEEFKLQCVDLEIKGKDVEKLFTAVDSVFLSFQKSGYDGVIELMDNKMKELITLRKSENRGAVENFPGWKVVAIVIALGAWIIGAIQCAWFNCSLAAGLPYYIIFTIAVIVASFC